MAQAKRRFHAQRERLEAKFLQLAAARAAPDAPRWGDCSFADDVAYVRSRTTGELSAFVAVTLAAEEPDARWMARGCRGQSPGRHRGLPLRPRPLGDGRPGDLELSPSEAIHYYRDQLEIVGEEICAPGMT